MIKNLILFFAVMIPWSKANALLSAGTIEDPVIQSSTLSSGTYCRVSVSTSAATRIDNFNGGCEGLMEGRVLIRLVNPSSNSGINCGFNSAVSTITTSSKIGEEFLAGSKESVLLSDAHQFWCFSQSTSAPTSIHIQQRKP